MKKRILALFVSAVMLIGLMPSVALAADGDVVMVARSEDDRSDPMYFSSLSDAMVYSVANDTKYIKLLQDTTSGVFIDVGKTAPSGVVFDLNGCTLTLNPSGGSVGTATNGFRVLYGKEATVKNGTVVAEFSATNRVKVAFANYGTLTLDGVTVGHSGDLTGDTGSLVAYTINNGGRLDVIGSAITNTVEGASDANLVLAFGDYKSGSLSNIGAATIDSNSVLNGDIGVYGVSDESSLTIDGTVSGEIIDVNNAADEDTVKLNGTLATADIASAVKYAAEGAVITLTEDLADIGNIVLPVGVTIDGNGYTISGNSSFTVAKSGTTVIKNVNFENIKNGAKLSAIYATGLAADADVTISGCSFDNMEWEAVQVTSSVDGATVAITDNVFRHTDATTASERHIHVQTGSAGYAMNLTVTGNRLYDCGRVKAAIGVYYITESGSVDMGGNYVDDVSGTDEAVSTIAVMLKGDDGYYNRNELVLPFMDETLASEVVYSFLAHGTGNNSWKGSFHSTFADAVAAATDLDTGEIVDTIDLVDDISVSDTLDLRVDGVAFNQNGRSITLTEGGSIISATELDVTAGEGCELVTDTTDGCAYTVKPKQFSVTFVSDGETVDSVVIGYGETVTKPADPSKDGYSFVGWYDGESEYDFSAPVTGDVTLTAVWEAVPSVSAPTRYLVTVAATENGTVRVSARSAAHGEKITVTVTPNEGCLLETLTVTDRSGDELTLTENADGTYGFTMPRGGVTVTATFAVDESEGETGGETDEPLDVSGLAVEDFTDIEEGAWYIPAVGFVLESGIMQGFPDRTFRPQETLTRAQLAQILYNLDGKPEIAASESVFADVAASAWYFAPVMWAAENGIVEGYDGIFDPDAAVTREQMAAMICRYAAFKGVPMTAEGDLGIFLDGDAVSPWFVDEVTWAVGVSLLKGDEDGSLDPTGTARRCEAAQMFLNIAQLLGIVE